MKRLSLSRAWEESRGIFARDGGLITAVALALLVLPDIVAGLASPPLADTTSVVGRVVGMVAAFVGLIGQLAIVRLALGPSTSVRNAIGHGARRFPATLGAILVVLLIIALVLIPLVAALTLTGIVEVPVAGQPPSASFSTLAMLIALGALLLAAKLIMIVPVASAEKIGPIKVLKRSWRLTTGPT